MSFTHVLFFRPLTRSLIPQPPPPPPRSPPIFSRATWDTCGSLCVWLERPSSFIFWQTGRDFGHEADGSNDWRWRTICRPKETLTGCGLGCIQSKRRLSKLGCRLAFFFLLKTSSCGGGGGGTQHNYTQIHKHRWSYERVGVRMLWHARSNGHASAVWALWQCVFNSISGIIGISLFIQSPNY
jgi:hypothetical protein